MMPILSSLEVPEVLSQMPNLSSLKIPDVFCHDANFVVTRGSRGFLS